MPWPGKRMVEYQVTLVQRLCNNLPHPWQFPWLLPHWLTICQFTPKAYKVSSLLSPYAAYEISRASFFSLFSLLRFLSAADPASRWPFCVTRANLRWIYAELRQARDLCARRCLRIDGPCSFLFSFLIYNFNFSILIENFEFLCSDMADYL